MRIVIDGQGDLIQAKGGFDPSTILSSIENTLQAGNRVVRSARFNGETVELEALAERFGKRSPGPGDELKLETEPLHDHILNLLDAQAAGIPALGRQAVEIAGLIVAMDNRKGLGELSSWSEEVLALLNTLEASANSFGLDLSRLVVAKRPLSQALKEIESFCSKVNEAMERNDRTAAADYLEFELAPLVTGLTGVFPELKLRATSILRQP